MKRAYESAGADSARYLELMREAYRKYKQALSFDKGAQAEPAGTVIRQRQTAAADSP